MASLSLNDMTVRIDFSIAFFDKAFPQEIKAIRVAAEFLEDTHIAARFVMLVWGRRGYLVFGVLWYSNIKSRDSKVDGWRRLVM